MRLVNADHAPVYLNEAACKQIKNMPTVDAVEVVRCKDCKHWFEKDNDQDMFGFCNFFFVWMRSYEFCSCGERKGGVDGG